MRDSCVTAPRRGSLRVLGPFQADPVLSPSAGHPHAPLPAPAAIPAGTPSASGEERVGMDTVGVPSSQSD